MKLVRFNGSFFGVILSILFLCEVASGQPGYQTTYDALTSGLLTQNPGTIGQDGYYNNGVSGTYSLIESSNSVSGQALEQVSPSAIGNAGQTIALRPITPVSLASNPVVTLSVSFYSDSSDLTLSNTYSAVIRAQQNGVGDAIGFTVFGGNGTAKSITGVTVGIGEYNGSNNNFVVPLSVGQNLAWDHWHQVTVVSDYSKGTYVSITVDGQTENLAGIPLPHGFSSNPPPLPTEIDIVNQEIIAQRSPGQATTDTIYWDNLSLNATQNLDTNLLLSLRFENTLLGDAGQAPTSASGVSYEPGIAGSGAFFTPGNQVFYPSAGSINATNGTLEFWIRPRWNGNDDNTHAFLIFGGSEGFVFSKDGANNLRMIAHQYAAGEYSELDASVNVASQWVSNQWHYVAYTWSDQALDLYIDGILQNQSLITGLPAITNATFQIGADGTGNYADAVFDELRISDRPRTSAEIQQYYVSGPGMPILTLQPVSKTAVIGGYSSLFANAAGALPLTYQWQFNGTNLSDSTNIVGSASTNLIIQNVQVQNYGSYQLIVTNSFGSATSSVATLTQAQVGAFTDLYGFTGGSDGELPDGGLIISGHVLYGTTEGGDSSGNGTVFKVNTDGTGYTVLHGFAATDPGSGTNYDGASPEQGVVISGNTLYGTAEFGGANGNGTIFAVNTDGTGFTNLYNFTATSGSNGTNSDGANPRAGLMISGGKLYGTTLDGGTAGNGSVFSINTDGSGFTNLHSFSALDIATSTTNSDGANPRTGLIISGTTLYGTAKFGGNGGSGTIFSLQTNGGNFTTLHNFAVVTDTNTSGFPINADGYTPRTILTLSGGTLFGTAYYGGTGGNGTVFKLNTNGTQFTVLHNFTEGNGTVSAGNPTNIDGAIIIGGLILVGNTLYGTAEGGGMAASGTVFQLNTDGTDFSVLHSFDYYVEGGDPQDMVSAGNTLYGTLYAGGPPADFGEIFSLVVDLTPRLAINASGTTLVLTWPTNATGFVLQASTNLATANAWTNISTAPVVVGGQYIVTNTIIGNQMFYRLVQ